MYLCVVNVNVKVNVNVNVDVNVNVNVNVNGHQDKSKQVRTVGPESAVQQVTAVKGRLCYQWE